jgi:tetratricopeptide (TPR) repeat protein
MSLDDQPFSAPEKGATNVTTLPLPPAAAGVAGKAPGQPGASRTGGIALLCWLVLLAVLLGSAPIRNTDVWLHLATGRAFLQGAWRFGPDPFLHTAGDGVLVVHSWLSDVLLSELFQRCGAVGLVAWRCFLLAALAITLLGAASGGRPSLLAGACVALTLLAVSVRVPLQPVCVSYLFLALTVWLLQRARRLAPTRDWLRAYGPLLVLFALWTNLDDWYLLGPFTVLLFLCGEAIAAALGRSVDLRGLVLLLLAGMLACLLNPWHIHGLTLPPELGLAGAARELRGDGTLGKVFASPLGQYLQTAEGRSVAGLAWLPLALLGAASFFASSEGRTSWRLPVWLGFFALAVVSARAVPFFAIVAGPVLALNLLDLRRRASRAPGHRSSVRWEALWVAGAVPAGVALVVLAWPGWLQEPPFRRRDWTILVDPSLVKANERLLTLRQQGAIGARSRGFNCSLEAANVLAWWAPEERAFFNARGPASAASDFLEARQALFRPDEARRYRDIFRKHQIDHVILYDPDLERLAKAFLFCATNPDEWALLFLDGRLAIFGWRDPEERSAPDRFAAAALDLDRDAFSPDRVKVAPDWGGRVPEAADPWAAFLAPASPAAVEADEAALYLRLFRLYAASGPKRRAVLWDLAQVGSTVGSAGSLSLPTACGSLLVGHVRDGVAPCRDLYLLQHDDGPLGLLFQAVRAARRAIRANPNDARGYLELGRAYRYLLRGSRERAWYLRYPTLEELRTAQVVTALRQAVFLDPNLLEAHEILADTYANMGYLDRTLEHQQQVVRLRRQGRWRPGERADERDGILQGSVRRLEMAERQVEHQKAAFIMNAENTKALDRARLALTRGLAGEALAVLLAEDDLPGAAGGDGVELELKLLFLSGRLADLHAWLVPELEDLLGKARYQWWQAMLAIVSGDYTAADQHLVASSTGLEAGFAVRNRGAAEGTPEATPKRRELPVRTALALDIGHSFLESWRSLSPRPFDLEAVFRRVYVVERTGQLVALLRHEADTEVLRGILALERGEIEAARAAFERALSVWGNEKAAAPGPGGAGHVDFLGRKPAQRMLDLIDGRP